MADSTQDFDMDIPEPELEFGDPTPTASDPVPAATPAPFCSAIPTFRCCIGSSLRNSRVLQDLPISISTT